jgi:osmotically-inducible protein OsmY
VAAELAWDPKIECAGITVAADGGAVTLSGTVACFRQVREAGSAAQRVYGVTSVRNRLTVRPRLAGKQEDYDVRIAVLHVLMLNTTIPPTINVEVDHGVVHLTGTATWHWQRNEAERVCGAVPGVLSLTDDIKLIPASADADIQQAILAAWHRNARLSLDDLSVDVLHPGVVILSGTVTTWADHDEAVIAGWSARGVMHVDDRIAVAY